MIVYALAALSRPVFSSYVARVPMTTFVSDLDAETLRCLLEALTESGQAVSIYDADDNLRYANKTYQGMFLGSTRGRSPSPTSYDMAPNTGRGYGSTVAMLRP